MNKSGDSYQPERWKIEFETRLQKGVPKLSITSVVITHNGEEVVGLTDLWMQASIDREEVLFDVVQAVDLKGATDLRGVRGARVIPTSINLERRTK